MANVETAIIKILNDDVAHSAIVSDRVRAGVAWEEDKLPFTLVNIPDDTEHYHLGGTTDLKQAKIDADCWADTADERHRAATTARAALNNYRGTVQSNGDTTHIRTIRLESRRGELEQQIEGGDTFLRGFGLTFVVWYV